MEKEIEIRLPATEAPSGSPVKKAAARHLGIREEEISYLEILRRSVDARKKIPEWILKLKIRTGNPRPEKIPFEPGLQNVSGKTPVLIAGFGPAGMFAALRLIALGYKPVVLERGKDIRGRRRDLAVLNRDGILNPESNYCFGEGGAGTFSDGKLYTRSDKRGNLRRILDTFVFMGADPDILIDAHPHIGTNKLPAIIEKIRETILDCGGEIHFGEKIISLDKDGDTFTGVKCESGNTFQADSIILATGHSARDIFHLLHSAGVEIEAKTFALGVRVEHPQSLVDTIQFHCHPRPLNLPAASYSAVTQVENKGVFSFCMCPGGIICPASTAEGELVVNGWSPSKRNSPFANSGIVTEISGEDLKPFQKHGVFSGLEYQKATEERAFQAGGGKMVAPAARLTDFIEGKISSSLPDCSYLPGIRSANLAEVFSPEVYRRLRAGFKEFGKKMKGYISSEAIVVATESRTSSPIRIPRDKDSLMHPGLEGLFPCGEGAGYAGGIVSAAMDGEKCAEAVVRWFADASV